MVQPMIGLRQNMRQPEHAHPAQAEALPVAVGGNVLVQQGCTPMRSNWASSSGISSTRSLLMVNVSVIPRAYHNVQNRSKFERTVSHYA